MKINNLDAVAPSTAKDSENMDVPVTELPICSSQQKVNTSPNALETIRYIVVTPGIFAEQSNKI